MKKTLLSLVALATMMLVPQSMMAQEDYTSSIKNADLSIAVPSNGYSEEGAWDGTGTKGTHSSGNVVTCGNNAQFDFKQTISLPAGQYKMTAQAAYRYSSIEADEQAAIAAGTETKFATLYATVGNNTVSTLVQNRWDGASDTDLAGEGAVEVNGKFVPNSTKAIKAWFAAGKYVNELVFNVPADGSVTIGIVKQAQPEAGDYTCIGPWTLTRTGDAEVEQESNEELTDLVQNGTFDKQGVIAPWKTTGGFQNQTTATNQQGAFSVPFFENWNGSAKVNKMYQIIENIPNGTYKLKIAAFVNTLANPNESQFVYANNDKVYLTTGEPTAYEVTTVVTDNKIEIGLEQTTATANWMGIDNVSLSYVGPKNQFVKEMALMTLEPKQSVKTKAALQNAYDTFIADESDANKEALKAAIAASKASINSYKILEAGVLPDNSLEGWTCTTFVDGQDVRWQVNTWSNEGNSDGTGMRTPFLENWTPKANVLGVGEIYYSLPGLDPGIYQFSALIRAYSEAGNAPTGASLFAGDREKEFATGKSVTYNNGALIGIYDTYAMAAEVGEDGIFRFGIKVKEDRNFNWMAFKNCKVAYVGAAITEETVNEMAATMPTDPMNAEVKAAADAAIAAAKATANLDNYEAMTKAVETAKASVEAYKKGKAVIDFIEAEVAKTNVYTAAAFATYTEAINDAKSKYQNGTWTDAEANAFNYGSRTTGILPELLLSAWNVTDNKPYINTWSVEGANDGTGFLVPFFEYWVGDGESLAARDITATIDGVQKGEYDVTAWVRVRLTNGQTEGNGISLNVNDGEAIDLTHGDNVETQPQFRIAKYTATGVVGEDGVLKINFNVAEGNNISWLSFQNVKYEVSPYKFPEGAVVYDFAAAAAAGENPGNLNGSAANGQAFFGWESASKTDSKRQDYKGYTWAEGSVLPEVCHVWRRSDRINGNVKNGGLSCPNDREMAVDGLNATDKVVVVYDATDATNKELVWAIGDGSGDATLDGPRATATIAGVEAVTGETTIASNAEIVVNSVTPADNGTGYIVFQVKKGMVIKQIGIVPANVTDGISTAKTSDLTNGAVYDLQGRRVAQPAKGLYIINGKKVVVK